MSTHRCLDAHLYTLLYTLLSTLISTHTSLHPHLYTHTSAHTSLQTPRYKVDSGPAIHSSSDSRVVSATDSHTSLSVVLKLMRCHAAFARELAAHRRLAAIGACAAVPLLGWHVPEMERAEWPIGFETEATTHARYGYALVLERGTSSLKDSLSRGALGPADVVEIRRIAREIVSRLVVVHEVGTLTPRPTHAYTCLHIPTHAYTCPHTCLRTFPFTC